MVLRVPLVSSHCWVLGGNPGIQAAVQNVKLGGLERSGTTDPIRRLGRYLAVIRDENKITICTNERLDLGHNIS